jgi:hypothetical protein
MIKSGATALVSGVGVPTNIRCPDCGQLGTFELLVGATVPCDFSLDNGFRVGERRCPNVHCRAILFFVWHHNTMQKTYPELRIDCDKTNIPAPVVSALEEAITCHASECYIAAAIMVRKTLEELCRERGAEGDNLKARIRDLGTKIVLPKELLDGLDDLRLLGNDAAHIESREYDKIGKEEVEVGIEFAKEVLKATYQYSTLLAKLRGLKKNP